MLLTMWVDGQRPDLIGHLEGVAHRVGGRGGIAHADDAGGAGQTVRV